MVIFHSYVKLPEGNPHKLLVKFSLSTFSAFSWWSSCCVLVFKVGLCLLSPNHEECLLRSHQERWVGGWGWSGNTHSKDVQIIRGWSASTFVPPGGFQFWKISIWVPFQADVQDLLLYERLSDTSYVGAPQNPNFESSSSLNQSQARLDLLVSATWLLYFFLESEGINMYKHYL